MDIAHQRSRWSGPTSAPEACRRDDEDLALGPVGQIRDAILGNDGVAGASSGCCGRKWGDPTLRIEMRDRERGRARSRSVQLVARLRDVNAVESIAHIS